MADKRETYAGLLSGDQVGKRVTSADGEVDGVLQVLVHRAESVAVFLEGRPSYLPLLLAPGALVVVS